MQKHGIKRKAPVRRWVHISELTKSNESTDPTQNDAPPINSSISKS